MGQEHFKAGKDQHMFVINNLDYIYQCLKVLGLEQGVQDVVAIEKELNGEIDLLIKHFLTHQFSSLCSIVDQFIIKSGDSDSSGDQMSPSTIKTADLSKINVAHLQNVN